MQAWREIAIGIDKRLCRHETDPWSIADEGDNHAWQAGHSGETERHHYALTAADLQGLNEEGLAVFLHASEKWHEVHGLTSSSSLPRSPPAMKRERCKPLKAITAFLDPLSPVSADGSAMLRRLDDLMAAVTKITTGMKDSSSSSLSSSSSSMIDASLQQGLQELMGQNAQWRHAAQREAAQAMMTPGLNSVVVRLPPAGGKSLLIMLAAHLTRGQVTLVVIPYLTLRADLRRRATALGLTSIDSDVTSEATLVFITPEALIDGGGLRYLRNLMKAGRVARIFFDECHTLLDDWRPVMAPLCQAIRHWTVPKVYLSATLPEHARQRLWEQIRPASTTSIPRLVSMPTNRPNIRYEVLQVPRARHLDMVAESISAQLARGKKTLIITMSMTDLAAVSARCGVSELRSGSGLFGKA